MATGALTPQQIWEQAVKTAKDRISHRSFWEALENSVPVTLENDTMVIGFPPYESNLSSFLTQSDHRNAIDRALHEITGRAVKMRVIDGATLHDWELTKLREQKAADMRKTIYQRKDRQAAEVQSWDALYETAARNYSNT